MLLVILGGAALQRCDNCIVLNSASAAEGAALAQKRLLPQPARETLIQYHRRWPHDSYLRDFQQGGQTAKVAMRIVKSLSVRPLRMQSNAARHATNSMSRSG